jgi:hypothetical protein
MAEKNITKQITDKSDITLQKRKEEYLKKKQNEIIKLIIRQTGYDAQIAKEKMETWDNNYLDVIKEYINPDFKKKPKIEKITSINQGVMGEIRHFMDTATKQYEQRKAYQERIQKQREIYINRVKQLIQKRIEEAKKIWTGAPKECWDDMELQKHIVQKQGSISDVLCGKTFCGFLFTLPTDVP